MAKKLSKKANIKNWKKGINNNKIVNSANYERNQKHGIRLTVTS